MAITVEAARGELRSFRDSPRIQVLFAQAHAKRLLLDTGEPQENFPAFDPHLDDRVTWSAYAIISAACVVAEAGERAEAAGAFLEGAELLEHLHRTQVGSAASFHMLLAAMAFYSAGHYSRAFVAMRGVETSTLCAGVIGAFLRRDAREAAAQATATHSLMFAKSQSDEGGLVEQGVTIGVARAVHLALEYAHGGDRSRLEAAIAFTTDAIAVASWGRSPAWWFIARLLRLMLRDLGDSSLWELLPPHFPAPARDGVARYTRLHAHSRLPAWELWRSQRDALPKALAAEGSAVLNLPTSGGKTRLAELAILRALLTDPSGKVLYLAPYRSLALEVEHTFSSTLGPLGFGVSHLYGGARVSATDTRAASEASILIATPEKARAMLRAAPESFQALRLIVIDEGHLLGFEERFVRNELFIDHVRMVARATGARLLLLSAVLPNAEHLAAWIGGADDCFARSDWKPSAIRLGALLWQARQVRLEWRGKAQCFNPRFVERKRMPGTRAEFPRDKNEAIAATATRLMQSGSVMIFCGQVRSVHRLARDVSKAFELEHVGPHEWPVHEWRLFEAGCREDLPDDAIELEAARKGILCHHAKLPASVRLAMERLMRAGKPRVIIATKTLAQGVNVGVTSVIVASVAHGHGESVSLRDFWNICGRAGRAFVDGEGRVLYAIDETKGPDKRDKAYTQMNAYFSGFRQDTAKSGVLKLVASIRDLALQAGVRFQRLLELMAENDLGALGDSAEAVEQRLDAIDDELLSLHEDPSVNPPGQEPLAWVDRVFRSSLAAVQADRGLTADDLVAFMAARTKGVLKVAGDERSRRSLATSGLPLRAALAIQSRLDELRAIADEYAAAATEPTATERAVSRCEDWVLGANLSVIKHVPEAATRGALRSGWLAGTRIREICRPESDDLKSLTEFYGYTLPWVLHAVAHQLRSCGEEERAATIDRLALLAELGLPNEAAALVYLAGVRSRVASTELAAHRGTLLTGTTVSEMGRLLRSNRVLAALRAFPVSPDTLEWLELLRLTHEKTDVVAKVGPFTLEGAPTDQQLHVRSDRGRIVLTTADLRWSHEVGTSAELPFEKVVDDFRYAFSYSGGAWSLYVRDPRLTAD